MDTHIAQDGKLVSLMNFIIFPMENCSFASHCVTPEKNYWLMAALFIFFRHCCESKWKKKNWIIYKNKDFIALFLDHASWKEFYELLEVFFLHGKMGVDFFSSILDYVNTCLAFFKCVLLIKSIIKEKKTIHNHVDVPNVLIGQKRCVHSGCTTTTLIVLYVHS